MLKLKVALKSMCNQFVCLPLILIIFSCSKESTLTSHIPKDAFVVVAVDVKSIGLKSVDFKDLLSLDNVKKLFDSATDTAGVDYKNSGIDFMNKAYFFVKIADVGKAYGAGIIALTDAKKFEDFVKKLRKDVVITEEGNLKIASVGDSISLGWNSTEAIFVANAGKDSLISLANLSAKESLAANSATFNDLDKTSGDVLCWMSFENIQKIIPQSQITATGWADLKGVYLTATCNFEDGQIVADSKYIGNDETSKKFNLAKAGVNGNLAKELPGSSSLIGVVGFALDMEKLYSYLESQKLDVYAATAAQFTGLTTKEMFGTLSGDVALSVTGIEMKDAKVFDWKTGQEVVTKQPVVDYCALVGLADTAKASQVLKHFAETGMLVKNENYYSFQDKVFLVEKGNALAVVGNSAMIHAVIDGSSEKLNDQLSALLTGNAYSVYVNAANLSQSAVFSGNNEAAGNYMKISEIEDITMTTSNIENNVSTSKVVIRFKEKGENSLITIARVSKKFSELMQEQEVASTSVPAQDAPAN